MPDPKSKKRKTYDKDDLLRAVAAVKNGMTYKNASEKYGVPVSTINDRCLVKYSEEKNRPGIYLYISPLMSVIQVDFSEI